MSFPLPGEYVRPVQGRLPRGRAADGEWWDTVDLAQASPTAQATTDLHMSLAYELGYLHGRRDLLNEQVAAAHAEAAQIVHRLAQLPARDELELLRGNPVAAQRIRENWARSGLRQVTP